MDKRDDYFIPEEIAEWIGLKKSEYLSKLIMQVGPDDFGFERYHEFNELIPGTLESADKVYEGEEEGQIIRTYIRSYNQVEIFHQIVLGTVIVDKNASSEVFVPILAFVTKKDELVRLFSVGQVISLPTLN